MRAVLFTFLALVAGMACAQIYTWRDASGNVHYSDYPPPGVDARKMGPGTPSGSQPAPNRGVAEQELEFRKRRGEAAKSQEKADKEKADAEEKRQNCEQAKAHLQTLESGQRMARVGTDGERVVLDDEARALEIVRTRKSVQDWCK